MFRKIKMVQIWIVFLESEDLYISLCMYVFRFLMLPGN